MPAALPPQQQWPRGPANDLHRAALDGSTRRTVALLGRGSIDINQGMTPTGYTPLMISAQRAHTAIVQILLSKGADVSIVDNDGSTALHFTAISDKTGQPAVIALLVEAGADLGAMTSLGHTPLHMAAQHGNLEVTTALVKAGSDPQATTNDGCTALHLAAQDGHVEVARALVKAGIDPQAKAFVGLTSMHLAAQNGHVEVVRALTDAGADLRAMTSTGTTPLHLAAQQGHSEISASLMEAGVHLNIKDSQGSTPLFLAAQNSHSEIVIALAKAGADVDSTDSSGSIPLHAAVRAGRFAVARALIDAGANVNARLSNGETPLFFAATGGHVDVVRMLLRAKADPLLATRDGLSCGLWFLPVDVAAFSGHVEVVRELIQQAGIEGCCGPRGGVRALDSAADNGHIGIMTLLIEAGVMDTGVALRAASRSGCEEAVKFLFQQQRQHQQRGKIVGEASAYVNTRDDFGQTPLACAIACGRCSPRVVRLLVDAGADTASAVRVAGPPGVEDVSSKTPLDLAIRTLRKKKVEGQVATQEQLHGLEGIRRLLLHVEAVHAVSYLWPNDGNTSHAGAGTTEAITAPTSLETVLRILRRRAGRRGVLLRALFRWAVELAFDDSACLLV